MAIPTTENNKHQGSSLEHIDSLIKAKIPYIWITTHEEERFIKALYETVTEKRHRELWIWSGYQGVVPASASALFTLEDSKQGISVPGIKRASGDWDKTWDPRIALEKIDQYRITDKKKTGAVFIMRDFNLSLQGVIPRQMRDMYNSLINSCKTVIIISPSLCHGEGGRRSGMESTLEKQVITVPYELPTRESIEGTVREWIDNLKDKKGIRTGYSEEEINKFSIALQGLTELEIVNAICVSVTHLKEINAPRLLKEKQQIIKRAEILEYINVMPALEDIGGLDAAKKYFATYNRQFSPEAIAYGVEPLKGILFVGVCGCGKSYLAKAIAGLWGLPLLRLDIGKVMGGIVGASEANMRQVVSQIESIAPAILWVDEIEKGLSGTKSSNFSDGGTLARVFGTLLTAMEEGMKNVVVIATANDIQALPPELIRRFSEILFVDLPVPSEREEIFKIHLRMRGRDTKKLKIKMDELVTASHNYTGSEIEKVVREAIARAFQAEKPDVTQEELLGAIKDTKPIATVMKEQISNIREWARDKARYASSLAAEAAMPGHQKISTSTGRELDLASALDDPEEFNPEKKKTSVKTRIDEVLDGDSN
jgi:ATP-dependent 26S proteasome regulatory subunit